MKPQALLNTILALPVAACRQESGMAEARSAAARETKADPAIVPPPEGRAFIDQTTAAESCAKCCLWPDGDGLYGRPQRDRVFPATDPMDKTFGAKQDMAERTPDAALLGWEKRTPQKKPAAVAMYRKPGFSPEAGDRFRISCLPDGSIEAQGHVDSRIACRRLGSCNDLIYADRQSGG